MLLYRITRMSNLSAAASLLLCRMKIPVCLHQQVLDLSASRSGPPHSLPTKGNGGSLSGCGRVSGDVVAPKRHTDVGEDGPTDQDAEGP